MEAPTSKHLIQELLEEEALAIGGLLAVHEVDDEFVWQLFQNLDSIAEKYVAQASGTGSNDHREQPGSLRKSMPHPAVSEFLARIRRA